MWRGYNRLGTPSIHHISIYLKQNIKCVTTVRGRWHGKRWYHKSWPVTEQMDSTKNQHEICATKDHDIGFSTTQQGIKRTPINGAIGKNRKSDAPWAPQAHSLEACLIHLKVGDMWNIEQADNSDVHTPVVANLPVPLWKEQLAGLAFFFIFKSHSPH